MAQRGKHQIQMAEVPGSMHIGVTFCCWSFWFLRSTVSDANTAIIANFVRL